MVKKDDQELIADCLGGQTQAFGALVERYQDRLFNTLVNIVGSTDEALDVAQDAFVQAFEKLNTFRGDSAFYSWLFRIAHNAAVSRHRKKKRVAVSIDAPRGRASHELADTHPQAYPGSQMELSERQQTIRAALAELPEEFRTVLVLKEIEGMKYDEIAEALDCPVGTVRSRIHRGRVELKGKLQRMLRDEDF